MISDMVVNAWMFAGVLVVGGIMEKGIKNIGAINKDLYFPISIVISYLVGLMMVVAEVFALKALPMNGIIIAVAQALFFNNVLGAINKRINK